MFIPPHGDCHCEEPKRPGGSLFSNRIKPFAPASKVTRTRGGFTLIEVAVTMVVMVVIIGIAMANFGSSSRLTLGREAKKLAYFMELVHDAAVTSGQGIGVSFNKNTPALWRHNGKEWVESRGEDDLGDGTVENGVKIAGAWVDGVDVTDTHRMEFHPSGSIAPYSIKLVFDGLEADLNGDIFGRVVINEKTGKAKDQ